MGLIGDDCTEEVNTFANANEDGLAGGIRGILETMQWTIKIK